MTKQEFLAQLRQGLNGLPQEDVEERLSFYGEMIDDRVEEGVSEEEAVAAAGSVPEIVKQTVADIPLTKLAKQKIKPQRKLTAWEIVLLVLGSPIWLSLLIAAAAVVLSLYVVLWSVIVSLWSIFVSLAACAFGGVIAGIIFACGTQPLTGMATLGGGLVFSGLSIGMFYGCRAATRGILLLTKKLMLGIKHCFLKKGDAG